MAVVDRNIINMAKAYSRQLDQDKTGAEARAYLEQAFGAATDTQVDAAIYEAQRGREVAAKLSGKGGKYRLINALGGEEPPSERVGVRVNVVSTMSGGGTQVHTLYIDMNWKDTISDVGFEVQDWIDKGQSKGYNVERHDWYIEGPTRWPVEV